MGSVLGSKNILAIVAYAEKDDYPHRLPDRNRVHDGIENLLHRLFSAEADDPRRTDGVMVRDEREFRQEVPFHRVG